MKDIFEEHDRTMRNLFRVGVAITVISTLGTLALVGYGLYILSQYVSTLG